MKPAPTSEKLAKILSWLAALIFILIPFHAFLTVWLASGLGHYTLLRLWKEFLLALLFGGSLYLLVNDSKLRKNFISSRLVQIAGLYLLLSLVWGIGAHLLHKVSSKALGYGLVVNLRFLIFFLAVWIIATKSQKLREVLPKLVLIPAAIVVIFGLLQRLVLPYDVLKHFGYSSTTIYPSETINHNLNYPRIMSSLRGANPLGAYLVLVISYLAVLQAKAKKYRWLWLIFGLAATVTLFLSYSRGAWLGLTANFIVLIWVSVSRTKAKQILLAGSVLLIATAAVLTIAWRHNPTFENAILHTQSHSAIKTNSNEGHVSAFRSGLDDALTESLGRGVGTAGPASVYNQGRARIAENYYIQLAQEVGWLGLALFLAINILLARELWHRRADILAIVLLASLVGLALVNLVSHGWTDDTIAYIFWGLAGVAMATPVAIGKKR
jgi:hypothetical protein